MHLMAVGLVALKLKMNLFGIKLNQALSVAIDQLAD
mgnify:CR=1 FL=1